MASFLLVSFTNPYRVIHSDVSVGDTHPARFLLTS